VGKSGRRAVTAMTHPYRIAYEWLRVNGIDELIPDRPLIVVDEPHRQLSVTCWAWKDGADRWDTALNVTRLGDCLGTEERTVALAVPLSKKVREAITRCGGRLVEHA
jgi:hypothetical protein